LELFAGPGTTPCNGMECALESASLRALKSRSKFARLAFLAPNTAIYANLQQTVIQYSEKRIVQVFKGNANSERSIFKLLDVVPRSGSGLVLIDPGGYCRLNWTTIEKIAAHGKNWQGERLELLIIFPLEMALLRNLMRSECEDSLTHFFGNRRWDDIKRQKRAGKISAEDIRYRLIELYKSGLQDLGYHYVEDVKPASPTADPYYHLIYAGDRVSRKASLQTAWGKTRFLRCELLYGLKTAKSKQNSDT